MRGDPHRLVALTGHLTATTPTRDQGPRPLRKPWHHTRENEIVWPPT
ncbi:hypothetical protein [Herbidospora yilanensis]|nr:hypothetical protein [Herbidospora yilanensis]